MDQEIPLTDSQQPTPDQIGPMLITAVLERWPRTADVFHDHAMACVGCAVASFYTINDAALVYGIVPEYFVDELLNVIRADAADGDSNNE